jgi:hypothetical protein
MLQVQAVDYDARPFNCGVELPRSFALRNSHPFASKTSEIISFYFEFMPL